jgi:hypothetical protein
MAVKRSRFAYWTAVTMAGACLAIVLLHHTLLSWKPEVGGLSLVWVTAGAAILAVLLYEYLDSVQAIRKETRTGKADLPVAELNPDKETAEETKAARQRA